MHPKTKLLKASFFYKIKTIFEMAIKLMIYKSNYLSTVFEGKKLNTRNLVIKLATLLLIAPTKRKAKVKSID